MMIKTISAFNALLYAVITITTWTVMAFLLAWPLMALWNWVMPGVFSLPTVTYWQAFGMRLLVAILFRMDVRFDSRSER